MPSLHIDSQGPEETRELGSIIGGLAGPGDIIFLSGPLGAGKTCLAQGIAQGLGVRENTASPSYVLMRELKGRLPLYHMDLYRLNIAEIGELGLDDYLYGQGVCVIEWAEKGAGLMPPEHLLVQMSYTGENAREIDVTSSGQRYDEVLEKVRAAMKQLKGKK